MTIKDIYSSPHKRCFTIKTALVFILTTAIVGAWFLRVTDRTNQFYTFLKLLPSRDHYLTSFLKRKQENMTVKPKTTAAKHTTQTNSPRPYTLVFNENRTIPYFYKTIRHHRNDRFKIRDTCNLTGFEKLVNNQKPSNPKTILFYNPPTWWREPWCEQGVAKCPVTSCKCTQDRALLTKADGIIVDGLGLKEAVAPKTNPQQVWIFFGLEPPIHFETKTWSAEWRRRFNWTMTYRLDSDIVTPYDELLYQSKPAKKNYTQIALEKTKSAFIITTNCKSRSKRETYIKELSQYFNVDTFGPCGPKRKRLKEKIAGSNMQREYRFYLAFENSFCDDYVTEKLFKIYNRNTNLIPIVRGSADYAAMIPEGTYINTASFSSARHLAGYLRYLERNVTSYAEMLRHKDNYVHGGYPSHFLSAICDVCVKLHNQEIFANHYTDIRRWLLESACH